MATERRRVCPRGTSAASRPRYVTQSDPCSLANALIRGSAGSIGPSSPFTARFIAPTTRGTVKPAEGFHLPTDPLD